MRKVFEKIIEKLKIEKKSYEAEHAWNYAKGLEYAEEIVKQAAAEYNNGWIPVEERLPEEHKLYDITFKNSAGVHSDSAVYNPYLKRWLWDDSETELVENEVLAWAEKREPYRREEGKDADP